MSIPDPENYETKVVASESDARTVNNTLRHQYRVLNDQEKQSMVDIKSAGEALLRTIQYHCPKGREQSLAVTKTEEAVMWAVKGLTD